MGLEEDDEEEDEEEEQKTRKSYTSVSHDKGEKNLPPDNWAAGPENHFASFLSLCAPERIKYLTLFTHVTWQVHHVIFPSIPLLLLHLFIATLRSPFERNHCY